MADIIEFDPVEELLGLGGQQRDLLLLHEHRKHGAALTRLDHERALAGLTERARTDCVDGIEFDGFLRHEGSPSGLLSGSGRRSTSPPVSLHFTSSAP